MAKATTTSKSCYDEFEQRTKLVMGNDVTTHYTYDPLSRRLATLDSQALNAPT